MDLGSQDSFFGFPRSATDKSSKQDISLGNGAEPCCPINAALTPLRRGIYQAGVATRWEIKGHPFVVAPVCFPAFRSPRSNYSSSADCTLRAAQVLTVHVACKLFEARAVFLPRVCTTPSRMGPSSRPAIQLLLLIDYDDYSGVN